MAQDSIIGSLFGITPEGYQQQQNQQALRQSAELAQLDPMARARTGIMYGANRLVGALGAEDPQLKLISARNAVMREVDPSNPESLMAGAQRLAQFDPVGANVLANQAREAQLKISQVTKNLQERRAASLGPDVLKAETEAGYKAAIREIKSREQTPENVAALQVYEDKLAALTRTKPEKYSAFAQTLIDAGLTPGTEPFLRRMNEYAQSKLEGAKKGSGNVTIGGITIDSGAASKEAGKNIGAKVANIEEQYSLQTAIQDATKLVGQGIYAGAFGPEKGFIAKYSGGMIGDSKKVQNTEVFLANIGEIVIPRLQQFGGNDSNEELKYLQKVVAGEQRLEPESMKRILESAEKKTRNNIARLQEQVKTGKTGGDLPLQPIQPAPSAPRVTKRLNPATGKIESVTGE